MEISKENINKVIQILKFIYPGYNENIQEWSKDVDLSSGRVYFVKKGFQIKQVFFVLSDAYMNDYRISRLMKKRRIIDEYEFKIVIKDKRWFVSWNI